MYNLPYFKEKDPAEVLRFIHSHPFALLAGCDERQKPVATQVPVFADERDGKLFLSGHLMKNTDHHKAFVSNPAVLCVFTGPHAYVSATWYTNPHQASTWNYISVHAKGAMRFLGEEDLVTILKRTSLHFENNDTTSPTIYDHLPDDYRTRLLGAIVAFEVAVESLENVFKLSQNHDKQDYQKITSQLLSGEGQSKAVAEEMKRRKDDLFSS